MFIQTENTPNPNAVKFYPSRKVSKSLIFYSKTDNFVSNRLAVSLFNVDGVKALFFGSDFITVTKENEIDWLVMKPDVLTRIMDFCIQIPDDVEFVLHNSNVENINNTWDATDLSPVEREIIEIIETKVRPSVAMDGGDVVYHSFTDGIVYLELKGACAGCPSSAITLKHGIESMLQYYVPEVIAVEEVVI